MDGFKEQKWFVYLGDHHEGPFSLEQIQEKMGQSQVTTANFVWAEGMDDWKKMTEVDVFQSILVPVLAAPVAAAEPMEPTLVSAGPVFQEPAITISAISPRAERDEPVYAEAPVSEEPPRKKSGSLFKYLVLLLVVGAGAFGWQSGFLQPAGSQLLKIASTVPFLGKWISPIPAIDDVSPEDYESMKAAATTSLSELGPQAAVGLSKTDPFMPQFYVSTNLPDGAKFDLYVQGIPETLLNQVSFLGKVSATTAEHLGKSDVLKFADGKPVPRGEYVVYVTEAVDQPEAIKALLAAATTAQQTLPEEAPKGNKIVAKKSFFLGGKRDAIYESRLKEFHDKLRVKATEELKELRQFASTLDEQYRATLSTYQKMRGNASSNKATSAQQKAWKTFHAKWASLDSQMQETFKTWSENLSKDEYFYGSLYRLVQQSSDAVVRLHQFHGGFFSGSTDPATLSIQAGEAGAQAESSLSALKAKLDQAESMAPTPNGMPRRESL